jgi:hypothetical protein
MKRAPLLLGGLVSIPFLAASFQLPANLPIYEAIRRHEDQEERNTPRLPEVPRMINRAQIIAEAQELARLAGSVPDEVNEAGKGIVAKELGERLKKIEKLSKRLRNELAL